MYVHKKILTKWCSTVISLLELSKVNCIIPSNRKGESLYNFWGRSQRVRLYKKATLIWHLQVYYIWRYQNDCECTKWGHFLYLFLYQIFFIFALTVSITGDSARKGSCKRKSEKLSFSSKVTFLLWLNEKREKRH